MRRPWRRSTSLPPATNAGRQPLFEQRVAAGRACDGHCDLLADDIFCLEDGPRVLDCLEFDDALRLDDTLPTSRSSPWTSNGSADPTSRTGPRGLPHGRPRHLAGVARSPLIATGPGAGQGVRESVQTKESRVGRQGPAAPRAHPHPPRRGPRATVSRRRLARNRQVHPRRRPWRRAQRGRHPLRRRAQGARRARQ